MRNFSNIKISDVIAKSKEQLSQSCMEGYARLLGTSQELEADEKDMDIHTSMAIIRVNGIEYQLQLSLVQNEELHIPESIVRTNRSMASNKNMSEVKQKLEDE
mgnify:CR=1 FL=1